MSRTPTPLGDRLRDPRVHRLLALLAAAGGVAAVLATGASEGVRAAAALAVALGCGAGAVALLVRRRRWDLGRLVAAPVFLLCAFGLLLPAAIGIVERLAVLLAAAARVETPGDTVLIGVAAAAFVLVPWGILRALSGVGDRLFLLLVVAGACTAKIAFLRAVEMPPTDDFLRMWSYASELAAEGVRPPRDESMLRGAYFERILLYFLPLQVLFGQSLWVYKLANVAVTAASSVLTFFLARHWYSSRAARVATLVSLLAVETWLASGIPSHDIPGAFWVLVAIALFIAVDGSLAAGRTARAGAMALALGGALVALGLQRSIGSVLFASMALVGLAVWLRPRGPAAGAVVSGRLLRRLAVALVVPWITYQALWTGLIAADWVRDPSSHRERRFQKLAAYTDSWGSGHANHWKEHWLDRPEPAQGWQRFARRKLVADLAFSPEARPGQYLRKVQRMFYPGSQFYFYLRDAELAGGGRLTRAHELRAHRINGVFAVLFLGLLSAGILRRWRDLSALELDLLPMVFLAALSSAMLLVGETQPRYLFPIWYLGSIYVGALWHREPEESVPEEDG